MEKFSDALLIEIDIYKQFQYLWKVDDPKWVEKRKSEWVKMFGKPKSIEDKYKSEFYVFGKEPPSAEISDDDYIIIKFKFSDRLWMTPFCEKNEIINFRKLSIENKLINERDYDAYIGFQFYTHDYNLQKEKIRWIIDIFLNMDTITDENLLGLNSKELFSKFGFITSFVGVFYDFINLDKKYVFQFDKVECFLFSVSWVEKNGTERKIKLVKKYLVDFFTNMNSLDLSNGKNYPESYHHFLNEIKNINQHPDSCQLLKDCYDEALK